MLVLGRKAGESIVIDGDIRVTILGVEGERVRIGVEAPRHVPVVRQELFDAVRDENLHAAAAAPDRAILRQLSKTLRTTNG